MVTHFDERFDEGLGEAEAIEIFQVEYLSYNRCGANTRNAVKVF
jgi:hypothetical protein